MINKGELDGIRLLKKETVDLMFFLSYINIKQGNKKFRFGLGFMILNTPK